MPVQTKVAPSLGALEGTHQEVWGTTEYTNQDDPTVFMGLYSLNDFNALRNHKGKKWIFWCGSDIRHFVSGYWLDEEGKIKINPKPLAQWISKNCESWVENDIEREELLKVGIQSHVCPSFMGNVNDYEVTYKHSDTPKLYTSVSGDDFELYGWKEVDLMASWYPEFTFFFYGNTKEWTSNNKNVVVRGRVPKEEMNKEIQDMQGSIRYVKFDGASEIVVKAMLWGQYSFGLITYPGVNSIDEIGMLKDMKESNPERQWWLDNLNKFPFNVHT